MSLIREFASRDNILIFDEQLDSSQSVYSAHHLQDVEKEEASHFWFQMRKEKICDLFEQKLGKEETILEIGGGTGFIARALQARGFSVAMADIHFNGLKYAQEKGIDKLYQFDLNHPPFQEEFDVVCLFDVLEHQQDDKKAMESLKQMIKPGGKILLTVPAHAWLWNQNDVENGHFRRYTKKNLFDLCRTCGLKVKHLEYFFVFILPLLYLRTFVKRSENKIDLKVPLGLNRLCWMATKLEFHLARFLPNLAGGSLLLMAEKSPGR